ncbi:heparan-alpha-glucosaminide N-acetyltransferase-like [Aphidius gifuensis]|uniref:heparan-alpha-glucosaminide N-acetyltransferase-like n=1 Tax=Aphidius gifuensis TaxID=684658 RepID=UPI001CDD17BA|nr:heparan-alpha-glucosaminide N-acetyltransferase-like [Aphidius gifuensis]
MSLFAKNDERCSYNESAGITTTLGIDEACISIINKYNWPISLYSKFDNCHQCDFIPWTNISKNSNTILVLSTKYLQNLNYKVLDVDDNDGINNNSSCQTVTYNFIDHGHYGWNLTMDNNCSQIIYEIVQPNNPYFPIFLALFVLLTASIIFTSTSFVLNTLKNIKKLKRNDELMENDNDDNNLLTQASTSTAIIQTSSSLSLSSSSSSSLSRTDTRTGVAATTTASKITSIKITKSSTRLQSIDAFRGISILLMIFVNNGGGKYVIFNHSPWYGLTIADLVLPWFLWIMGMTMVLSLRSQLRLSISPMRIIYKGFKRSLILIILGIIVNSLTANQSNKHSERRLENLRFFGVLQLCGITNFISLLIEMIGIKIIRNFQYRNRLSYLQDILDAWKQWLIVVIIISINLTIQYLLIVPGCPSGYFGPGGYDNHSQLINCTGGAVGYIDRKLLSSHIYNKTNNIIYGKINNYDPEGLMNILSSILTVQFGIHAGRILFCYYLNNISKIFRWFMWSIICIIICLLLCNGDIYNPTGIIPISKNLMTLSFILLTCSLAFLLFLIIYYLIDHRRVWNGAPFIYSGRNSIFIYMAHYLTMNCFPWSWQISPPLSHANVLAMNIWTTMLWSIVAYYMNKKDIIITV